MKALAWHGKGDVRREKLWEHSPAVVGVCGGFLDKIPMGSAIDRGPTFRVAQTPVQHYLPDLPGRVEKGEIDPSFVVTHRASLDQGPELNKTFRDKKDGCIKVVLKP
jgi:threonine dehydrogenase-like Zn-dependent dehydrogenase